MASSIATSASKPRKKHGEATVADHQILMDKISLLKEKIQKERMETIKDKLEKNGKNLQCQLSKVMEAVSRNNSSGEVNVQMVSSKSEIFKGFPQDLGKNNIIQDVSFKNTIKLPYVEKIPRYTVWSYLVRNEKMTKDQSFGARRNIYYAGGETMICSDDDNDDTDEEVQENTKVKHDFSHGEDQILWMAFEEHGLTEEVSSIVQSYIGGTNSEIQERYEYLKEKDMLAKDSRGSGSNSDTYLDKSLNEALKTFDHFFCRRCLIFDCPLHGCSQPLISSSQKQPIWHGRKDAKGKPCGDHCYLVHKLKDVNNSSEGSTSGSFLEKEIKTIENVDGILAPSSPKEITDKIEMMQLSNSMEGQDDEMHSTSQWKPLEKDLCLKGVEMFGKNRGDDLTCHLIEKKLDSMHCLIRRNLLSGFKTCMEIAKYMHEEMPNESMEENGNCDAVINDNEMPSSSRRGRKKGKSKKKFKYLSKSLRIRYTQKSISAGEKEVNKHYTPCQCEGMCSKEQCPCLLKGSCCEKFCGCDKQCIYRYRGCLCVKSQCRSRHCPCFAAKRECDPDICKNCWASCGDGTLEAPLPQGDGQCENMNLLLGKNKQRILLARSDVAGWGAFLKNPANKNDYLGEYTGELISHREADKRGRLYEHGNFSFLFDVDDKYCIDAYRMGDKLKFANHSSKPNCYAKGMFVGGEHRVAIFAKQRIEAGEELFYDYRYTEYQRAPSWFHKANNNNGSKKKESSSSHGKAKKRVSC